MVYRIVVICKETIDIFKKKKKSRLHNSVCIVKILHQTDIYQNVNAISPIKARVLRDC